MKRRGDARRAAIVDLVPRGGFIVDVGADHGRVAAALGAVATERLPHRRGSAPVRWVVADGLRPFYDVDVAIIAGMGASAILGILAEAPPPRVVVLHAADDPARLRRDLGGLGWRIDAERLAPENDRFAEVIRAVPGAETATGHTLETGPRLLAERPPELLPHLRWLAREVAHRHGRLSGHDADGAQRAAERLSFLRGWISLLAADSDSG